jgi:hypothetical protein
LAEEREPEPEKKAERPREAYEYYLSRPPELEPDRFEEGFTVKTVMGALFVGFIMMPGSIYLGLLVGRELGAAAEWTTIILFNEVARRSFTTMRRQELYLIFYMAGGLMSVGGIALSGGPFAGWIWNQYLVRSPAAAQFGISNEIPHWVVPGPNSEAITKRLLWHRDWYAPEGLGFWLSPLFLLLIGGVIGRLQWIGSGYFLFRTTSDVERLPFPFAPIAAQGATALAEVSAEKETWRWPVFSVGAMIGLSYGFIYVAVPVFTGAFLTAPLMLIKIPFIDLTPNTEGVFPAAQWALGTDLGAILAGFVVPYPIVIGGFISAIVTNTLITPTMYRVGASQTPNRFFPDWRQGMDLIQTNIATNIDFWMSIGIGIAFAIAIIGFFAVGRNLLKGKRDRREAGLVIPPGRGDFPLWVAVLMWFVATTGTVILAHVLIPRFPLWILLVFGYFWSPINSYVSARLVGITGRGVGIPYLKEAAFILSGYKGIDIWFAPIPLYDYGGSAQSFREFELTGTRFISILKAEVFMYFLLTLCSFLFWSFYWRLGPIPSPTYPYAQTFWPMGATMQSLWVTATREQKSWLLEAIKTPLLGPDRPPLVESGLVGALALYGIVVGGLKMTPMWFYGLIGGVGAPPSGSIPMAVGAVLGRFYFAKRFGFRTWQLYGPVMLAGYACGTGLIGMFSIALAIIFKAVRVLPY